MNYDLLHMLDAQHEALKQEDWAKFDELAAKIDAITGQSDSDFELSTSD